MADFKRRESRSIEKNLPEMSAQKTIGKRGGIPYNVNALPSLLKKDSHFLPEKRQQKSISPNPHDEQPTLTSEKLHTYLNKIKRRTKSISTSNHSQTNLLSNRMPKITESSTRVGNRSLLQFTHQDSKNYYSNNHAAYTDQQNTFETAESHASSFKNLPMKQHRSTAKKSRQSLSFSNMGQSKLSVSHVSPWKELSPQRMFAINTASVKTFDLSTGQIANPVNVHHDIYTKHRDLKVEST